MARNLITMIAVRSNQRDDTELYLQAAIITINRLKQYVINWDICILVDEYTACHYGELYSKAGARVIRLKYTTIDYEQVNLFYFTCARYFHLDELSNGRYMLVIDLHYYWNTKYLEHFETQVLDKWVTSGKKFLIKPVTACYTDRTCFAGFVGFKKDYDNYLFTIKGAFRSFLEEKNLSIKDLKYGHDEKFLNYLNLNKGNSFICTKFYGHYRLQTWLDPQKFATLVAEYTQELLLLN